MLDRNFPRRTNGSDAQEQTRQAKLKENVYMDFTDGKVPQVFDKLRPFVREAVIKYIMRGDIRSAHLMVSMEPDEVRYEFGCYVVEQEAKRPRTTPQPNLCQLFPLLAFQSPNQKREPVQKTMVSQETQTQPCACSLFNQLSAFKMAP